MTRTIIVPLDTSREAEAAVPVAEALARRVEGQLLLFSVIEAPSEFAVWLRAEETVDAWVEHHIDVDQYLTRIAETITGVSVETTVSTGNPAPEIASFARQYPDPLIVMTSHARTGVETVS
jgi:nucleotide-binding universal stress UspA family protein